MNDQSAICRTEDGAANPYNEKIRFIDADFMRLSVKPDDIIVVQLKAHVTMSAIDQTKQFFKESGLPNKVLILSKDASIGVLSPND